MNELDAFDQFVLIAALISVSVFVILFVYWARCVPHPTLKKIFCRHDWQVVSRNRYHVTRYDGSKEGEVTLTLVYCPKCEKDTVVATDRVHLKP
jgi:hypothetical protein